MLITHHESESLLRSIGRMNVFDLNMYHQNEISKCDIDGFKCIFIHAG